MLLSVICSVYAGLLFFKVGGEVKQV